MLYILRTRRGGGSSPRLCSIPPKLRRSQIVFILAVFCVVSIFLQSRPDARATLRAWLPWAPRPRLPGLILEPDGSGSYDWQTTSAFDPVRLDNVSDKAMDDICSAFPTHLFDRIQPVLKTGHKLVEDRVRAQLKGPSACLKTLLIFSDTEEEFNGHRIVDIIAEIPKFLTDRPRALKAWRSGAIAANAASDKQGWNADKFKFMPALSRAWKTQPNKEWYVFFEGDTYVSWDTVFRMLGQLDADESHFFGSPTPGDERTWFAYGGPGYILSREAMRRYVAKDWDPSTGEYLGPKLTEEYWSYLTENCCGDAALGWVLWWQNVTIRGLFPMFNPAPPFDIVFADRQWCQPIMTLHLGGQMEYASDLWKWEWENRQAERPLLYRDLAISYFDFANLRPRDDWNNAQLDGFVPPHPDDSSHLNPHDSFEACGQTCEAHPNCLQWTYHLRECTLVRSIRYGKRQQPGFTNADRRKGWLYTWGWDASDTSFKAGWASKKIQKWMDERPCDEVVWVKPSTKRIF